MNAVKLAGLLLLLFAIVLLFSLAPRFRVVGGELLENSGFEDGLEGWKVVGHEGDVRVAGGVATIFNREPLSSTMLIRSVPVPPKGAWILVQADIRIEFVIGGPRSYQRARIYLVGQDSDGKSMFGKHHSVALLEGTESWARHAGAIPTPGNAVGLVLGVGLAQATGIMQVRNLNLLSVSERPAFRAVSLALLMLLAGVLLWLSVPIFRSMAGWPARTGLGVAGATILVGVMLPAPVKSQVLDNITLAWQTLVFPLTWLADLDAAMGWNLYPYLRQLPKQGGHLLLFALLAVLSRVAWPEKRGGMLAIHLLAFAATTETLQFYAFDRGPSLQDLAVDAAGILLGLGCVFSVRAVRVAICGKAVDVGEN